VNFKLRTDDRRPINVDIAFPRLKVAVFVDGCFWHGCKEHRTIPVANRAYWAPKIEATASRDQDVVRRLEQAGWTVVRVWEHEDINSARNSIVDLIVALRIVTDQPEDGV
jgi:DNA mismatch endonuclease (patch repair protein)